MILPTLSVFFFSVSVNSYLNLVINHMNLKLFVYFFTCLCVRTLDKGYLHINTCNCSVDGHIIWFNVKIYLSRYSIVQSLINSPKTP